MYNNKDSYTFKNYSWRKVYLKNEKLFIGCFYVLFFVWYLKILIDFKFRLPEFIFYTVIFYCSAMVIKKLFYENFLLKQKNYNTWGKGAGAELVVGNNLSALGPDYKIISDFQNGHGNIDFIVIEPKGVFTIEVKANKGNISCQNYWIYENGQRVKYDMIKQTEAEAFWLTNFLKNKGFNLPVTGILEFPYGHIETNSIHGQIDGIWVGGMNFHSYVINKSQNQLSQDQINEIEKTLNNFSIAKV